MCTWSTHTTFFWLTVLVFPMRGHVIRLRYICQYIVFWTEVGPGACIVGMQDAHSWPQKDPVELCIQFAAAGNKLYEHLQKHACSPSEENPVQKRVSTWFSMVAMFFHHVENMRTRCRLSLIMKEGASEVLSIFMYWNINKMRESTGQA